MNRIKLILASILVVLIQVVILSRVKIYGVTANLALPFVVAITMGFGSYAAFCGLFIGLLEDLLFSDIIGLRALIYFVIGFLIGNIEYRLNIRDNRTGILITILVTLVNFLCHFSIELFQGSFAGALLYLKGPIFIELLMNVFMYLIVITVIRKFFTFSNVRYF